MKKKLKISTEKAFEVVNVLKTNVEILQEKGKDTAFIKTLETSVKKMDRLEKELVTLKERLNIKKSVFEQEKEVTLGLVRAAKNVLKEEVGKKKKSEKEQKPEKEKKSKKKPKAEKKIDEKNPEIAVEAEEPK
jgi:hypothetical protein